MNWNTGRSCRKDPVTFTQAECWWPHSQMHEFASPFLCSHTSTLCVTPWCLRAEGGQRSAVEASEQKHFFRAVALARISTSVLWFQLTSRVCQLLFARLWDWQPEPTVFRGLSHAAAVAHWAPSGSFAGWEPHSGSAGGTAHRGEEKWAVWFLWWIIKPPGGGESIHIFYLSKSTDTLWQK